MSRAADLQSQQPPKTKPQSSTQPTPHSCPRLGRGSKDQTAIQSTEGFAKSVGVAGPGLGRRKCGSQGSFSPQPIPLHLRKYPTSQRAERAVRPAKCCESPDFHVVAQDPAPSPRPRPPARGNRKGRAATALGGSAGSGGGLRSLSGAAAGPLASRPAQAGQGTRGTRGAAAAASGQGLITWRGALPLHPQANCAMEGGAKARDRASLSQVVPLYRREQGSCQDTNHW